MFQSALFVGAALLGTVLYASAQEVLVAGWNFEAGVPALMDSASGPVIGASTGTGNFQGIHASGASDWSDFTGNGSPVSYGADNNWTIGDYFQFSTSTDGYEGITISVDQSSSAAGPRDFQLSYSADGTNFTNFGSIYPVVRQSPTATNWTSGTRHSNSIVSFDLSAITALNDVDTVYFRLTQMTNVSTGNLVVTAVGSSYIDNVMVSGIAAVPEPTVALLSLVGMLGFLRRRRE